MIHDPYSMNNSMVWPVDRGMVIKTTVTESVSRWVDGHRFDVAMRAFGREVREEERRLEQEARARRFGIAWQRFLEVNRQ